MSLSEPAPGDGLSVVFTRTSLLPEVYPDVIRGFQDELKGIACIEGAVESAMLEMVAKGRVVLFVFLIADSGELLELLNFLPKIRNTIREKRVAVLVMSKVKSDKVEDVLKKAGCAEILRYDLSVKGIFFKIRRYVQNLKRTGLAAGPRVEQERILVRSGVPIDDHFSADGQEEVDAGKRRVNEQVVLVEPLGIPGDYWLLRRLTHIRRYHKQWHVELIGPSPACGKWKLTNDHDRLFPGEESIWAWTMRDPPGRYGPPFDVSPGSWVFTGKKPEYSWEINRWSFLSGSPGLYLVEGGGIAAVRFFENDEGMLEIHKNSASSVKRFVEVLRSFDHPHFAELEGQVVDGADPALIPLPPEPNAPWADRRDSKRIKPSAWNHHDLEREEGPEWADSEGGEATGNSRIPLGANAMRDCGLRASVEGEEVDLESYSEDEPVVVVGTLREYAAGSRISIEIRSENLNRDLDFDLNGSVTAVEKMAEGQSLLTVHVDRDSHRRISLIREAVRIRQEEIFSFFKRAKG